MVVDKYLSKSEGKRSFFDRYAVVLGTFLAVVTSGIVISSFGVFFKPVSADFGWARAETSGAFSLATILSGLGGFIAGRMGDRFNPRLIIVICGAVEGIAFILLSHMTSLWQLYFYYGVLVGAGMANVVPASSLATRWYPKQRGLMAGITMAGAPIGTGFAPPLTTVLISRYGWSISYIIIGCLALVIIAMAAKFLYHSAKERQVRDDTSVHDPGRADNILFNEAARPEIQQPGKTISFQEAVRTWPFWCLGLILFSAYFSQQDMLVHIVPHATDIGISPTNAALILTAITVANVFGNFGGGGIIDKTGSRRFLAIIMAILAVSSILLLVANSLIVLYAFAVLFGFAWGGTSTLRTTMVAELFGMSAHGAITGAVFLISVIGGTIAPLLTGYIFDVTGKYHLAFVIIVGLSFFGLIMNLFLFRRNR